MTESNATAIILKKLRERYPGIFAFKITLAIGAGLPDAVVVINGTTIWIEFKGVKTPITPLQQAVMEKMERNGATVIIVRFTGDPKQSHTLWHVDGSRLTTPSQEFYPSLFDYLEATCRG